MRDAWTLVMLLVALVRYAQAQPSAAEITEAERLFEEARTLLKDQHYREACDRFARSFELGHLVGAELNLGDCAERDGHLIEAWRQFDAAARDWERDGETERARHARAQAERVATKLAAIVVVLDNPVAGVTVQIGTREVPAASEIRELVEPGPIDVVVTLPDGRREHRTVQVRAGAVEEIKIQARHREQEGARRTATETAQPRSQLAPLSMGIGAIALAGAALWLWHRSADTYDQSRNESDDVKQRDLFDRANLQYHAAQGIGAASVVAASAAVWLYVRSKNRAPSAGERTARLRLAPLLTGDRTGLLIEGRY
jgi:hypothetical protein